MNLVITVVTFQVFVSWFLSELEFLTATEVRLLAIDKLLDTFCYTNI